MSFPTGPSSGSKRLKIGHLGPRTVAPLLLLNPFHRGIPYKLMDLQRQPSRNSVRQHPLRQFSRIQQATRCITGAGGLLAERGREQYGIYLPVKMVMRHKFACKLVVSSVAQDKLDLVLAIQPVEVLHVERVGLTRVRTFYIHDLDHPPGHTVQRTLAAGLE